MLAHFLAYCYDIQKFHESDSTKERIILNRKRAIYSKLPGESALAMPNFSTASCAAI